MDDLLLSESEYRMMDIIWDNAPVESGKLVKLSPSDHIDGTAALLNAMCVRQKHYASLGARLMNEGK